MRGQNHFMRISRESNILMAAATTTTKCKIKTENYLITKNIPNAHSIVFLFWSGGKNMNVICIMRKFFFFPFFCDLQIVIYS